MAKYRTKPVEIEATQWNGPGDHPAVKQSGTSYFVMSRQGLQPVNPGDFIITLADGETYPCPADVFRAKYEAI